jgi:hypothetical protein
MREPCSEKTSSKLLLDHSAALPAIHRDTRLFLHIYSLKFKGRDEKERYKWRIIWFRKSYVLRVDGFTAKTAKDIGPTMYLSSSSLRTILKKLKLSHNTQWRRLGERIHSSYSFTTSALDADEWSASRPGRALPPVPIVQEAGWDPEPVWTQRLEEKSFRLCRG